MPRKPNYEEKLTNIEKKIEKLRREKNQTHKKLKLEERKKRTRNLIQIGAIMHSIGIESPEVAKNFKDYYLKDLELKIKLDKIIKELKNIAN